jgi:hypothetical protein
LFTRAPWTRIEAWLSAACPAADFAGVLLDLLKLSARRGGRRRAGALLIVAPAIVGRSSSR